jgi:hypothetical protein
LTSHDALGGVPVQLALHCPPQVALHEASQSASAPPSVVDAEHFPEHVPSQRAEQSALQSSDPGLAWHLPLQSVLQDASQSTLALAVHWPLHCVSSFAAQATSKLTGVHWAVHPPCVSTLHCASAETLMLPHALRSARASPAETASARPPKKPPTSQRSVFMRAF